MTDHRPKNLSSAGAGRAAGKASAVSPDHSLDTADCLCFALRKSARAVTQTYDAALEPIGLRTTQFSLLETLRAAGPLTVSKLAESMVMDRTTLTRNLAPVEKQGLIKIAPGRRDKRTKEIALTAKGANRLAQAEPLWRVVQNHMRRALGAKRSDHLLFELDIASTAALAR
jgi:DNA-binding MarR family transcriptional regulator